MPEALTCGDDGAWFGHHGHTGVEMPNFAAATSRPMRHFVWVVILSILSALCSGCNPGVKARAADTPPARLGTTLSPWQSQEPAAPLDERRITPRESAGASDV